MLCDALRKNNNKQNLFSFGTSINETTFVFLFDSIANCKSNNNNVFNLFSFYNLPWQVIEEYDQNVHYVEIDIEEDPEIAEAAGIMGTPCVQYFKNREMLRLVLLDLFSYSVIYYLH